MSDTDIDAVRREVVELIKRAGFDLTPEEWDGLVLNDFGLGDFRNEGAAIIDILRTPLLRITILALLPNQTLPEHRHPATEDGPGKEETLRVLWGSVVTFQPGDPGGDLPVRVPAGKEACYTSRRATALGKGDQHTLPPGEPHWFQAGPDGVVTIEFQNRVDETRNIFTDPGSAGIPITASD